MSLNNPQVFSASDRIKQLNKIDKDVAKLLESAGLAIRALTKPTSYEPAEVRLSQPVTTEQQKESFTAATSQYFTLLSSVDVNLRRQICALEEAEILPAEAVIREPATSLAPHSTSQINSPGSLLSKSVGGSKAAITGSGLGNLDVGWLHGRNDNVGKEMKLELWEEAENFVHKLEKRKASKIRESDSLKDSSEEEAGDPF